MKRRLDLENEASGFRGFIDIPENQILDIRRRIVNIHEKELNELL